MIDLHCHSTFSDGALSPEELIKKALANKVSYLALTDHDTIAGYNALKEAASSKPITLIPGIEFSVRWKKYDIHILGYHFNETVALHDLIAKQNTSRIERAQVIGELLHSFAVENAYEKASQLAGHQRVGRPHFAQLLVNEGKVKDVQAAFKRYLGKGKPAYKPTLWVNLQNCVECLTQAGGKAVIAHPLKYGLTRSKLHELIENFKECGGEGMEVISGEMTSIQVGDMAALCSRFELLASSGSDFHGDGLSRVNLGLQQKLPVGCKPIWHDWEQ